MSYQMPRRRLPGSLVVAAVASLTLGLLALIYGGSGFTLLAGLVLMIFGSQATCALFIISRL